MSSETSGTKSPSRAMTGKAVGLAFAAAVGGFLFGFDSSVINGAINAFQKDFGLGAGLTGFAVAVALLGCAVGAFLAGNMADKFGRKPTMLIGSVLFLVSAIGSGLAYGVVDLIIWRVIGGLGIGIASVVAPAYIAEISPKLIRGRLASLQQLAIVIGIFAALLSDAVLSSVAGDSGAVFWFGQEAWRWMFMVEAVPAVVYGIIALKIPESPRFLMNKGKAEEARAILESVWAADDVEKAMKDIKSEIKEEGYAKQGSLRGSRLGLRPIVWIGILLSMFQQFVGINVIFYYSNTLWQAVGFDESNAFLISVLTSITNVVVTIVAIIFVDRIGRRLILLIGSAGMTISLVAMAVAFSNSIGAGDNVSLPSPWSGIALVGANLFVVFFGASWGPVVWVLLGEIFPNRIRGRALGVAAMAQWIANFLVTISFPALSSFSLGFTYGMYGLFALLSFFFVLRKIPETKGLSLEQADTLFTNREKGKSRAGPRS